MAIVNGRRLYRSDKLRALAAEDDQAAGEYAWLMAGTQDDWGRFRLSPRAILGRAYESRPQVNELMVAGWLTLYERHELLALYVVEGTTYAEWTNYLGDPPSQRRFHSCPEPPWTDHHKHNKRCTFRDDAKGMQVGKQAGRQKGKQPPTQPPTLPLPSVPAVPSGPSVPAVPSVDDVVDHPRAKDRSGESDPPGFDRDAMVMEAYRHIRTLTAGGREDADTVVRRCSTIPTSGYYLLPRQLDTARPEHLERTVIRLRDEARTREASKPAEGEIDPTRLAGLAEEFCLWYGAEGREDEHRGTALMRWLEIKGIPYHLSISRAIDDRLRKAS